MEVTGQTWLPGSSEGLKGLSQWVVAICVTISSDIFFFESSYLLVERQECGPLRLVTQKTTIPEIYQTSETVVKGRHLTDCLSSNKMNTETAFFLYKVNFKRTISTQG